MSDDQPTCGLRRAVGRTTFVCVKPPHPTPLGWKPPAAPFRDPATYPPPGDQHYFVNAGAPAPGLVEHRALRMAEDGRVDEIRWYETEPEVVREGVTPSDYPGLEEVIREVAVSQQQGYDVAAGTQPPPAD